MPGGGQHSEVVAGDVEMAAVRKADYTGLLGCAWVGGFQRLEGIPDSNEVLFDGYDHSALYGI